MRAILIGTAPEEGTIRSCHDYNHESQKTYIMSYGMRLQNIPVRNTSLFHINNAVSCCCGQVFLDVVVWAVYAFSTGSILPVKHLLAPLVLGTIAFIRASEAGPHRHQAIETTESEFHTKTGLEKYQQEAHHTSKNGPHGEQWGAEG